MFLSTALEQSLGASMFVLMLQRSGGRRTVPQIFIGERHSGGFDGMAALDRSGELNVLLGLVRGE